MEHSLEKYKYYQFKNENGGITIVALSSYGGKPVKGYAKCDPRDDFDFEAGKKLAAARCNMKVAKKRRARAAEKYLEALEVFNQAKIAYENMREYYMDADDKLDDAALNLRNILSNFT
jgi:hypothetical protein